MTYPVVYVFRFILCRYSNVINTCDRKITGSCCQRAALAERTIVRRATQLIAKLQGKVS